MDKNTTGNAVGWFEIYVDDIQRARKFYEGVFDTRLEVLANPATESQDMQMLAFPGSMTTYGANGTICKMPGFPAGKNSIIIYFSSEDCSVEEGRVEKFGGKVEKKKMSIGQYGFISLVFDSEKNMIGIHSLK